ncbi:hypothetical protein CAEBREN_04258 [Caenorhabditis brenneri]|uniref:Ubiquitin-like domain-containing protein n=1 Tax=Caenorhabditis brenneri TaxID=135651 RepID=G0NSS4_CAEBE|nr:hypothetical protein CAEBREN_04258 [Caenorhabditis brenneri]
MKRTDTVLDLKKIVDKRIGVNAENLCCFVGGNFMRYSKKLILDCYDVQQTEITENCVVQVMQGNPDTPTTC